MYRLAEPPPSLPRIELSEAGFAALLQPAHWRIITAAVIDFFTAFSFSAI